MLISTTGKTGSIDFFDTAGMSARYTESDGAAKRPKLTLFLASGKSLEFKDGDPKLAAVLDWLKSNATNVITVGGAPAGAVESPLP